MLEFDKYTCYLTSMTVYLLEFYKYDSILVRVWQVWQYTCYLTSMIVYLLFGKYTWQISKPVDQNDLSIYFKSIFSSMYTNWKNYTKKKYTKTFTQPSEYSRIIINLLYKCKKIQLIYLMNTSKILIEYANSSLHTNDSLRSNYNYEFMF